MKVLLDESPDPAGDQAGSRSEFVSILQTADNEPRPKEAVTNVPRYNVGESFPSSARRTILMGGKPCFMNLSWNSSRLNSAPRILR